MRKGGENPLHAVVKPMLPLTIDLPDGKLVIVNCEQGKKGGAALTIEHWRGDKLQGFNNPWVLINPPLCLGDRTYDPFGALVQIAKDKFSNG